MNKKKIKILIIVFSLFFFFGSFSVNAFNFSEQTGLSSAGEKTGHTSSKIFKSSADLESSIGSVIQTIISFIGVIFVVLLVYGGILWMTARGNDQQVEKAKSIIVQSIIGLFIVVSAYSISVLVISAFNFQ
jgi:hypothetical protein